MQETNKNVNRQMKHARSEQHVLLRIKMILDVFRGRVVGRIASNVGLPFPLIHPYVLDEHFRWELNSCQVDRLPIC
jgi:hypothetical protein